MCEWHCVCMYLCGYLRMYVTQACVYVCLVASMYSYMCSCAHVCMHVSMHACMYVCMHACKYVISLSHCHTGGLDVRRGDRTGANSRPGAGGAQQWGNERGHGGLGGAALLCRRTILVRIHGGVSATRPGAELPRRRESPRPPRTSHQKIQKKIQTVV